MKHNDNQVDPLAKIGIDRTALERELERRCREQPTVVTDGAAAPKAAARRTPADLAAQLGRDATSLTLTGESFERDRAFYDGVAANIREAVSWLASWEPQREAAERAGRIARAAERTAAMVDAVLTAVQIKDAVEKAAGASAYGWTSAGQAIVAALIIRQDAAEDALRRAREGGQ